MKPWQYWIAFVVCLALVFAAMGWVSVTALRLDNSQMMARQQAAFEENVRLALWRMETTVSPLIARESMRPYFSYAPFYEADKVYTRKLEEVRDGKIMMPSPLLTEQNSDVILNFQVDPKLTITSPQAPVERERMTSIEAYDNGLAIEKAEKQLEDLKKRINARDIVSAFPANERADLDYFDVQTSAVNIIVASANEPAAQADSPAQLPADSLSLDRQMQRNTSEWGVRVRQQAEVQGKVGRNKQVTKKLSSSVDNREIVGKVSIGPERKPVGEDGINSPVVKEGTMKPMWIGNILVLVRRVTVDGQEYVQGCWLDWPAIKKDLLSKISDLFPSADLQPVTSPRHESPGRMLAALPVKLVPGHAPAAPLSRMTPVRFSIMIAWCCLLLGAVAVGALLVGAVSLGERRADFVSAVTHELRTPLTTFRMYAEMLSEGMVRDDAKRRHYLQTLCAEGNRLSHLVENVLSYARLERGKKGGHTETLTVADIIARVGERLKQRTGQCGMIVEFGENSGTVDATVRTDLSAVEQILFNLVDNACKYAAAAEDKRIHVESSIQGKNVVLCVRDHGSGISAADHKRLFKPFSKSAKHAAESAPGVGLGLALSRRLARQMGGDLKSCGTGAGACFELSLPIAESGAENGK